MLFLFSVQKGAKLTLNKSESLFYKEQKSEFTTLYRTDCTVQAILLQEIPDVSWLVCQNVTLSLV